MNTGKPRLALVHDSPERQADVLVCAAHEHCGIPNHTGCPFFCVTGGSTGLSRWTSCSPSSISST